MQRPCCCDTFFPLHPFERFCVLLSSPIQVSFRVQVLSRAITFPLRSCNTTSLFSTIKLLKHIELSDRGEEQPIGSRSSHALSLILSFRYSRLILVVIEQVVVQACWQLVVIATVT